MSYFILHFENHSPTASIFISQKLYQPPVEFFRTVFTNKIKQKSLDKVCKSCHHYALWIFPCFLCWTLFQYAQEINFGGRLSEKAKVQQPPEVAFQTREYTFTIYIQSEQSRVVNLKYFFTSPFFVPRNSVQNSLQKTIQKLSHIHCWPDVEIFWHYFFHLIRADIGCTFQSNTYLYFCLLSK